MSQTKRPLKLAAVAFSFDHCHKLEKAVADSTMDDFHLLFGISIPLLPDYCAWIVWNSGVWLGLKVSASSAGSTDKAVHCQ